MAWYNKGLALNHLDKYDEAIKAFDKTIEIRPDDFGAWHNNEITLHLLNNNNNDNNIDSRNSPAPSQSLVETPSQTQVQHTVKEDSRWITRPSQPSTSTPKPSQKPAPILFSNVCSYS